MSAITISVKFDEAEIKREINAGVKPNVRAVAFAIEAAIKLRGSGPKTGRTYPRPGGGVHVASAPGESPASDTGFLYGSIQTQIISDTEAVINIPAEYAEILEFENNRPFVQPAVDSVIKDFSRGGILEGLRG